MIDPSTVKVGDRVQWVGGTGCLTHGDIYVVVKGPYGLSVKCKEGDHNIMCKQEWALASPLSPFEQSVQAYIRSELTP